MKMSAAQRDYLKFRVNEIYNKKKKELDEKYKGSDLSDAAKIAQIRSGEAKLKNSVQGYHALIECFIYKQSEADKKASKLNKEGQETLLKRRSAVMDEIMLEGTGILDAIKAFEDFTV